MMNAFCILFSDSYGTSKMSELSSPRTLASVPFGGRFRLVDFMLSSLVGAKVNTIGIVTRDKYGSLMDHVGWGKDWDLNRKNGGIKFLTPFLQDSNTAIGENKFESLNSIIQYIKTSLPEYCIICDANIVFNIDLSKFLDFHAEKGADICFVYKNIAPQQGDLEVTLDENGKVVDALCHTDSVEEEKNVAVNIVVMKKDLLISLVEQGVTYGWHSIKRDVFAKKFNSMNIYGYKANGYLSIIRSVNDYYNASMDLLKSSVRKELFMNDNQILTRIKDSVPTIYGENCNVKNSLIADGCNIDGTVENCIVFRDVKVEKGAVIKNSIIMQNTVVRKNSLLSCVITDKDVEITEDKILAGSESMPFIINKGKIV